MGLLDERLQVALDGDAILLAAESVVLRIHFELNIMIYARKGNRETHAHGEQTVPRSKARLTICTGWLWHEMKR